MAPPSKSGDHLRFPSPYTFTQRPPITLVELRMRRLSGEIRSKPDWWHKVHDPNLVAKWRGEMAEQDRALVEKLRGSDAQNDYYRRKRNPWPRDRITDTQLDYIFDQLKYDANRVDVSSGVFATTIPKVYESRSLIPPEFKAALLEGVAVLESVPEEEKDWHPGTNKQVLDIVHPSLYCLRIGSSYIRNLDPAVGDPVQLITEETYMEHRADLTDYIRLGGWKHFISNQYQWLPTDFEVSEKGDVKALSYINNLHPIRHSGLYPAISSVLARFVPMFEQVLSDTLNPDPPLAIDLNPYMWYEDIADPSLEELKELYPQDSDSDSDGDDYGDDDYKYDELYDMWKEEHRWPLVPEPDPFVPPTSDGRVKLSLKGRTLQVIVKLANIVLTPDNPKYPGGSWHIEGMANENIVATGLYYYACSNITESRLGFRACIGPRDGEDNLEHQTGDDQGYVAVYGFGRWDAMNQCLGHVVAEEDKCIAFPNVYQHRVDEFELADASKAGFRKILCFFLVDPFTRIASTSDVPPQQADWVLEEMAEVAGLKRLPQELFDIVCNYASAGTISRKEAEEDREKLMKERSNSVQTHNRDVYELSFNMCEH